MSLTDEQKRKRLEGVGGSEVGALVGVNPYMKPIDVYSAKVEGREVEDNHHMERGRFFERPVAEWWAHRRGAKLTLGDTMIHPAHPRVIATPDFIGRTDDGLLDVSVKVPSRHTWSAWGTPGTDEAPPYAIIQAQYEMAILGPLMGIVRAEIVAPIDDDLAIYPVSADPELQAMLIEAVERFWRDHIEPRRPPPPDASDSYSRYLKAKFPADQGEIKAADSEASRWADSLRRARADLADAEAREKLARQHLEAFIGEASGVEGDGWRVMFSATKGRLTTDWQAVIAAAEVPKFLIEQHTKRTPYRMFKPTFKDGKNE